MCHRKDVMNPQTMCHGHDCRDDGEEISVHTACFSNTLFKITVLSMPLDSVTIEQFLDQLNNGNCLRNHLLNQAISQLGTLVSHLLITKSCFWLGR